MTITQPNYWDLIGDKQIVRPVKRQMEKADRRAAVEARKKEEKDEAEQLSLYKAWKREVKKEMQIKYGKQLEDLMKMLKNLSLDSSDALVETIKKARWLIDADAHSRITILSYIDAAIIKCRIVHGLSPFDDALPGEPDTAFQIIRHLLTQEN